MSPSSNTNNSTISLSPPPPPTRHRASSIRSAITLPTLGRRRSASNLQLDPPQEAPKAQQRPQPDATDAVQQSNQSSMLVIIVSRFLEWLHVHPNHSSGWSTPSSPRSSTDDLVLPLSASAQKISFPENIQQVPPEYQRKKLWRIDSLSSHAPIITVILLLPISTAFVLWSLSTLPISLTWPRTLSDVAQLGRELHGYAQSGRGPVAHVVGVMAITAVWKHAWSIPGSVIWNVVAGALFSPLYATILLSTLTTIGSLCATLLAMPLAPFLTHFFPRALDMTRNALGGDSDSDLTQNGNPAANRSSPWVRLSVLRLIGVVPWSGINIACGVCGVSIYDCTLGAFIGCLPWTAVTCQIGDILQTVASTPSPTPRTIQSLLTSPEIILKLIFLTFLSLAPILGRKHLHQLINSSKSNKGPAITVSDADASKRNWVEEWRMKLRLQSRSRPLDRQQSLKQLAILVDEKRALDALPS